VREAPGPKPKNYITPAGLQRLKDEHKFLLNRERPAVTQVGLTGSRIGGQLLGGQGVVRTALTTAGRGDSGFLHSHGIAPAINLEMNLRFVLPDRRSG
jgi:hypothetical protein